jgi:hypothetical protein
VENSYQNRFLRKAEMNSVLSLLFCHRCEIDRHSTVSNEVGHLSIVRTMYIYMAYVLTNNKKMVGVKQWRFLLSSLPIHIVRVL